LALVTYDICKNFLDNIVNFDWGNGKIGLCGGIIINTPEGMDDLFMILDFVVK